MGCSNSKSETNETNITLPAFNTEVLEEQQIRILSEMLVNENKGDFRKFRFIRKRNLYFVVR